MKPTIISFDCTDHDPIEKWVPDDVYDVDIWVNFTIGLDMTAGDNFEVRIVTPNNLKGRASSKHAIVLLEYSWPNVLCAVQEILDTCEDINWLGITEQLSRHMHWEYSNYQPYKGA